MKSHSEANVGQHKGEDKHSCHAWRRYVETHTHLLEARAEGGKGKLKEADTTRATYKSYCVDLEEEDGLGAVAGNRSRATRPRRRFPRSKLTGSLSRLGVNMDVKR